MKKLVTALFAGLGLLSSALGQETFQLEVRLLKLNGENPTRAELMEAVDQPEALLASVRPLQLTPGQTVEVDETITRPDRNPASVTLTGTMTLRNTREDVANIRIQLAKSTLDQSTALVTQSHPVTTVLHAPLGEWTFFSQFSTKAVRTGDAGTEHVVKAVRVTRFAGR